MMAMCTFQHAGIIRKYWSCISPKATKYKFLSNKFYLKGSVSNTYALQTYLNFSPIVPKLSTRWLNHMIQIERRMIKSSKLNIKTENHTVK